MVDLLQRKMVMEVSEAVTDSSGSSSSSSGVGEQFKARFVDFCTSMWDLPMWDLPICCFLRFPCCSSGFPFRLQQQGQDSSFPNI